MVTKYETMVYNPPTASRARGASPAGYMQPKPHQLSVQSSCFLTPYAYFANDKLPVSIRVSSVPVLRRDYPPSVATFPRFFVCGAFKAFSPSAGSPSAC